MDKIIPFPVIYPTMLFLLHGKIHLQTLLVEKGIECINLLIICKIFK